MIDEVQGRVPRSVPNSRSTGLSNTCIVLSVVQTTKVIDSRLVADGGQVRRRRSVALQRAFCHL